MNARLLSVGLLVLAMLTVVASDPECPLINCVAGSRVGCLITKERCRCFCGRTVLLLLCIIAKATIKIL